LNARRFHLRCAKARLFIRELKDCVYSNVHGYGQLRRSCDIGADTSSLAMTPNERPADARPVPKAPRAQAKCASAHIKWNWHEVRGAGPTRISCECGC
jgi:hypothetical protein